MKLTNLSAALLAALASLTTGCNNQNPEPATALTGTSTTTNVEASCTAQGWAAQSAGANGGGTATATVVTTYDQLKAAITNAAVKVVQVNGIITIPSGGRISFQDQSGKTLFGSAGAKLVSTDQTQANSGIMYVKRCSNVVGTT
jgi:pectate lyase